MKTIISITLIGILASPATATYQRCFVAKRQAVVVKRVIEPVILEKQVNVAHYFVGAPAGLSYPALQQAHYGQIERQFRRLQDRLEDLRDAEQQYASYQQPYQQQPYYAPPQPVQHCPGGQACPTCAPARQPQQRSWQEEQAGQKQWQAQQPSVLQNTCAQCHTGRDAKGDLDVTGWLSPEQREKMLRRAAAGEMPPPDNGERLSAWEFRQLYEELAAGIEEDE